ncbi:MAG: hypothetical protein GEU90_02190 [Gemmatimonas sp.]|nr:hypothetical protein [Gemmatimonas sp.]
MDWFTVVLILLFFVLPLVQQVREQARRKQRQPLPDQRVPEHDLESSLEQGAQAGRGPVPQQESETASGGWSEEWMPWPSEREVEKEPAPTMVGPPPDDRIEWAPLPPPTRYEPPAPEQVEPRKVAVRIARQSDAVKAPVVPPKRRAASVAPSIRRRSRPPIARFLDHPDDLRRALILREVLGPPASMRRDAPDLLV